MTGPSSDDLEAIVAESLARLLPWRKRFAAWLTSLLPEKVRVGNGGYWGGVTFWDRVKAAAATAFLRR